MSEPSSPRGFTDEASAAVIRRAVESDAQSLLALREALFAESDYLLWEPGESRVKVEEERKRLRSLDGAGNSICLVAVLDGVPVGFLNAIGFQVNRLAHATKLALAVRRSHWGKGIGAALLGEAMAWSRAAGLVRVELTVHTSNHRAIALYRRFGFEVEGLRRSSLRVAGRAVDEYLMSVIHAAPVPADTPATCGQSVSELVLRPAVPDDALCLSVLAMQVFLDTYATQGIRRAVAREVLTGYSEQAFSIAIANERARICVAEMAAHLVGFAHVTIGESHQLAPAGAQSELLRLYVQEPFTGRHVGTQLLAEAERLAVAAGSDVLWLTPWVHNHRALGFYRRRGYADCGQTCFVFEGESHENRLYAKRIAPPDGSA
ncbi:GNAT family N-acetyltransferase [Piscinibacter sakaiensis]|uniref:GNAT family N-acetyltransferase n=1 Tax=Piscinibacter sakaiensis TaxID=1547922 RepID=UPI003AAFAECD